MDDAIEAAAAAEKKREELVDRAKLEGDFSNKLWRLTNLYWITDEMGKSVPFKPRSMQLKFLEEMWYLNCILKARQHGFTTLITLWILDECIFFPDQTAGVIAHNLDDGQKIFRNKVKHPWDRLPAQLKAANPATNDRSQELVWSNGSQMSVSTSTRSGTCQYLLVTEFGKIAARFPEKADEIVSGAFNTVHPGNYLFVESTAEGRSGHFFDLCRRSQSHQKASKVLTKHDFKFHFYPWWANDEYQLSEEEAKSVVIGKSALEYFRKLERGLGVFLAAGEPWAQDWARVGPRMALGRIAWWVKKRELNGSDLMKREYPSTPDEAFESSIKGAYFAEEMQRAREEGRISRIPHQKGVSVDTWWDIGRRDKTAVWFTQTVGRECRLINYYERSLSSLTWFLTELFPQMQREHGYHYRHFVGPHDMSVHEYSTGTSRFETARKLGATFKIMPQMEDNDQIDNARNFLSVCYFDEALCEVGIEHLENFRKEWNEHLGQYMEKYLHDQHSHGATAFMTGAAGFGLVNSGRARAQPLEQKSFPT